MHASDSFNVIGNGQTFYIAKSAADLNLRVLHCYVAFMCMFFKNMFLLLCTLSEMPE